MKTHGVYTSKADFDDGTAESLTKLTTASGAKMGFYGATAVAQPASASQATITATWVTISDGAQGFGFQTSDQIISVIAFMKEVANTLKTLGVWKGSA